MEITIVKFFQGLSNSFLDIFFELITRAGEETFFLIIFVGIYLCYDRFFSVKYALYYLISVGINSLVKGIFCRPRPHEVSSMIVNRLPAGSSSFPSGHTQGYFVQATIWMNEVNIKSEKKNFKIPLLILLASFGVLVMISRMYFGQHFLSDVVVGMMFGVAIPFVLDWLINLIPRGVKSKLTEKRIFLIIGILCSLVFSVLLIFEFVLHFFAQKVHKFLGVFIAMSIGYFIDKKYVQYTPNQGWRIGLIKFIITVIALVISYILLTLLISIDGYGCFVVYFIMGLIATIVLPLLFKTIFKIKD